MIYIVKRTNERGESLNHQLCTIHGTAKNLAGGIRDFDFHERNGSIKSWLKWNRERAKDILARLDKIEDEFIERWEDEEGE